jgi:hypothetical protein
MMSLSRRLRKLESVHRTDTSGFVPYSDEWFDFYERQCERVLDGEDIGNIAILLAVIDRIVQRTNESTHQAALST